MSIYTACLMTIAVETAFFLIVGYRDKYFVTVCICVNAATNLTLNLLLSKLYYSGVNISFWVYPLELAVLIIEFSVYALIKKPSWKLFGLTAAANALSYGLGLLAFGHV